MAVRAAPRSRWAVAAVLTLFIASAGGTAQVQQPPRPPQAPRRLPVKPPDYDLAIVRVDATLRWQGGLEELARFDVELTSRGVRDILEQEVTCTVAGKTFRPLSRGRTIKRDERYQFTVQVRGGEAWDLKPGRHPVACTARIVRPEDARDAVPENDSASGLLTVDPLPRTDLVIQSIVLRDCETRGPAVVGRAACAEVTYLNQGPSVVVSWQIACEAAGTLATAPGVAPMDRGVLLVTIVSLGRLPAGAHQAECVVDAKGAIDETSEENNRRADTVLVLPDSQDVRYDLAITGIGGTLSEARDQTTAQPYVWLEVTLKNEGTQPILQADARCELAAAGIVFVSSAGGSYQPGEEGPFKVQVWGRRLAQIPAGKHEVTCAAGIVQPASVIETDVANNVLTGTVAVRK